MLVRPSMVHNYRPRPFLLRFETTHEQQTREVARSAIDESSVSIAANEKATANC